MRLIRLVTWNLEAEPERVRAIKAAGFEVDASPFPTAQTIGHIRALSPSVVVIDLDRLPSHGRSVAVVLRTTKSTCQFPIVFAGGAEDKIERVRKDLPDAVFTDWRNVGKVAKQAAKNSPISPAKTVPYMQQWAGSSLVKKLGFKENLKPVALLNAPDGFEELLGDLPPGVELKTAMTRQTKLVLWFVRSRAELEGEIEFLTARLGEGCHLWIVYPKQASRYRTDFTQYDVRAVALAEGLVDYKVCAVDGDWTGLKFARKKTI